MSQGGFPGGVLYLGQEKRSRLVLWEGPPGRGNSFSFGHAEWAIW